MTTIHRYSGFALRIHSEVELPELSASDGEADVVIRIGTVRRVRMQVMPDEEYAFNTLAGAFHIRSGREITVEPRPDGDPAALRVVLLGRVMAFLLRQRGWLPLHGSAIVLKERAVIFVGDSGAGKSTMAAAFHARGHLVIADDVSPVRVVADRCFIRPSGARLRLFQDSKRLFDGMDVHSEFQVDKFTIQLSGTQPAGEIPVHRIYHLETGNQFRVHPVAALRAATLLSRYSFARHHKLGPEAMKLHLRDCASVAASTPVCSLERPMELKSVSRLAAMVEEEAETNA